jgi:hypothetical protein
LLRGDDQIEINREVFAGGRQEIIIDIGQDSELEAACEPLKRRICIRERLPKWQARREKACPVRREAPAERCCDTT